MKKVVLLFLALITAFMAFAPNSIQSVLPIELPAVDIMSTLETKDKLEAALSENKSAAAARTNAMQNYQNAVAAFDSQRTVDIHYTDVYRIQQLLSGVQGVTFVSLHEADPNANWAKGMELNVEDYKPAGEMEVATTSLPQAVCMTLIAENIPQGLAIVDRLALPVCQILTTSPGTIEVTFLTGGGGS